MIYINEKISIDESEIHEEFIRSSGPGGQNVNKVATAVQLRFDVSGSVSLPDDVRERLVRIAGKKVTKDGELILKAARFRTQEMNRKDALERLIDLIKKATEVPRPRRKTKPTKASKERRMETKHKRSEVKATRRSAIKADE
jgi:ribosome-associated protein